MPLTIIEPTASAVTTKQEVRVTDLPATISATNLDTDKTVDLYFSMDNGKTWEVWSIDDADVQLTATDKSKGIYSPILLGVTKTATAAASGVYLTTSSGEGKL